MNMKKYINALGMILLTILALTCCKEEAGTTPGTDGAHYINMQLKHLSIILTTILEYVLRPTTK